MNLKKILPIALLFVLTALSCSDPRVEVSDIELSIYNAEMLVGDILTVSVTVTAGEASAECSVTVTDIEVEEVTLNETSLSLSKGETVQLEATVFPEDAGNGHLTWSSSDGYVASVTQDGVVEALAVGSVTISAEAGNGVRAECTVEVSGKPSIGDYFYSDGTWSTEVNPNKIPVAIVFWAGDPTVDDEILRKEHPDCTNGLAVSLEDVQTSWLDLVGYRKYKGVIGEWIEANTDYLSCLTDMDDGKTESILGYGITKGLYEFNASEENSEWQIQFIVDMDLFKYDCPDVPGTSGWFMPSICELDLICNGEPNGRPDWQPLLNKALLDTKLEAIGAQPLDEYLYWSCLELDGENALDMGFDVGTKFYDYKAVERMARYVFALKTSFHEKIS